MKYIITIAGFLFLSHLTAQQSAPPEGQISTDQVSNLPDIFKKGHFNGSIRSYFMATDNTRQLSDYHALAAGGTLFFNSASYHGFRIGMGGSFHYNLASSDLAAKDSTTGAVNRYEIGLFDVENPGNKTNLNRMEELWMRYEKNRVKVTLGRQLIQSPLVNDQDGRMRPTAVSGIWLDSKITKNTRLEGGWLWGISPRSTVRWYHIGESIGLYPKGLNPDGTASGYPEHVQSNGIGLLGLTQQFGKYTKVQVWNQFVENVFNTAFARVDFAKPFYKKYTLIAGIQFAHQDALASGGNENPAQTYFDKNQQSNTISAQLGWKRGDWQVLSAFTRITGEGRFLSPREWGREPFYTFMSRERIEGSGDVRAYTGRIIWQPTAKNLRMEMAYGQFYLPDIKNYAMNKYAFPAYRQLNVDIRYSFKGMMSGARLHFLYVWKGRMGDVYGNDKYVINRVNMSLYNLIFNYSY